MYYILLNKNKTVFQFLNSQQIVFFLFPPFKFDRNYSEEEASWIFFYLTVRKKKKRIIWSAGKSVAGHLFKERDSKKLMPNSSASISSYNVSLVTFSLWHPKGQGWFTLKGWEMLYQIANPENITKFVLGNSFWILLILFGSLSPQKVCNTNPFNLGVCVEHDIFQKFVQLQTP